VLSSTYDRILVELWRTLSSIHNRIHSLPVSFGNFSSCNHLTMEARVGIGRLKRRFEVKIPNSTRCSRGFAHSSLVLFHCAFADVFADSAADGSTTFSDTNRTRIFARQQNWLRRNSAPSQPTTFGVLVLALVCGVDTSETFFVVVNVGTKD